MRKPDSNSCFGLSFLLVPASYAEDYKHRRILQPSWLSNYKKANRYVLDLGGGRRESFEYTEAPKISVSYGEYGSNFWRSVRIQRQGQANRAQERQGTPCQLSALVMLRPCSAQSTSRVDFKLVL